MVIRRKGAGSGKGGVPKKSVEGHVWYRELRRRYPDDNECWLWDRNRQVSSGAFFVGLARVSVRPYLYACLIGDGTPNSYDPGAVAGPNCVARNCINPRHAVTAIEKKSAAIGHLRKDEEGRAYGFMYLKDLVNAVWNSTATFPEEMRDPAQRTLRAAIADLEKRHAVHPKHVNRMRLAVAERSAAEEPYDLLALIRDAGFTIKAGTVPERFHVALNIDEDGKPATPPVAGKRKPAVKRTAKRGG